MMTLAEKEVRSVANRKHRQILSWLLLIAAICMIGFCILRDEQAVVLKKAINICLECIGIG